MYRKILVPVDLAHADRLNKALSTAADLARHYDASLCYVAVTASAPTELAHSPEEFARKLQVFADRQSAGHGQQATSKVIVSPDPAVDLDRDLLHAIEETGADLVVMASHVPGIAEHVFFSHAGYVAAHAAVSVFVIR